VVGPAKPLSSIFPILSQLVIMNKMQLLNWVKMLHGVFARELGDPDLCITY
jgi:hypothetical protein